MAFANIRELAIALSKARQDDIATAVSAAGDFFSLRFVDPVVPISQYINESDEAFIGKGDEFATQLFPSHKTAQYSLTGPLSSEKMAFAGVFGLGGYVKSGAFIYTCNEYDPIADGIELPYLTLAARIRTGGAALFDRGLIGASLTGFRVSLKSGPGIDNSQITFDFKGSGRDADPSGITFPALAAEHLLNASSLACTIIGTDYVTLKRFVTFEWGWTSETDDQGSIFPGSGTQDGFAVAGRIEVVRRVPYLTFTCRLEESSAELAALKAQTTGTAVFTQTYDAAETYTATFQKVGIETAEIGNVNGIVTIQVTCRPMKHTSNGVIDLVAKTAVDGIGDAAA